MTETVNPKAAKKDRGLTIARVFSTEGVHPYDQLTWERRDVVQTNWKTGEVVFEQAGVEFPDFVRKHMESSPARLEALFEGDAFIMEMYGFDSQPVTMFYVDIRGNGNPMPALAALCVPNGWAAIENASGQPLNLTGSTASVWQSFRKYRDGAVSSILNAIRDEPA